MLIVSIVAGLLMFAMMYLGHKKMNSGKWTFPLTCVGLPLIYVLFAMLVQDFHAMKLELVVGLPFIVIGLMSLNKRYVAYARILGLAWIAHGVYDLTHDHLFINSGVPSWYPMLCFVVDIVVGGYLLLAPVHELDHSQAQD